MKRRTKRSPRERGQAVLLVLVALSVFLMGAFGLALDGSTLYAQRQMAQAAADAAAQAGIMSILDKTNDAADSNSFGGASFTCASASNLTPCYYARINAFGPEYGDTVQVDFPTSVSGVTGVAADYTPSIISVTITRTVNTTLMKFLGVSSSTVVGHATAAIMLPPEPIPILVTHETKQSAFLIDGGSQIKIRNGPSMSIQVNSCSGKGGAAANGNSCDSGVATASSGGNGTCNANATCIDLTHAGPDNGPGKFGSWGTPSGWSGSGNGYLTPSSSTTYLEPSSPFADPLANIASPTTSGRPVITSVAPSATNVAPNPCIVLVTPSGDLPSTPNPCQNNQTYGCPGNGANNKGYCYLYYPGVYSAAVAPNGIVVGGGNWALFAPGLYYIAHGDGNNTGFELSPANATLATGFGSDAETGTGMTVYLTGNAVVNIQGGSTVVLNGDSLRTRFGGMLFFKDRADVGGNHHLAGGSGMTLTGTIYITKDAAATDSNYNNLYLSAGNSTTNFNGEIIVDTLHISGGGTINMNLSTLARDVHQVALVQ